jgi:hypothetical protein
MKKLFSTSHFLAMKHGSIYLGMSTPKTATAFNEMMETPLLDQKFGVW